MGSAGELNAFLASVEKRAYSMALVSVKNPDDALDIVQDVMLTLARKYAQKPAAQWRPLFYRILRNRITDWHRSATVRNRVLGWFTSRGADEGEEDPIENSPGAVQDNPDHRLVMDGARHEIADAVGRLPARQREAFMFRVWEGLDVKETASAMGCSEGSVKTHYSRAIHTLRDALREYRDE
jgi:RNA polymerase sigma-70 factor (ECF subfamily)